MKKTDLENAISTYLKKEAKSWIRKEHKRFVPIRNFYEIETSKEKGVDFIDNTETLVMILIFSSKFHAPEDRLNLEKDLRNLIGPESFFTCIQELSLIGSFNPYFIQEFKNFEDKRKNHYSTLYEKIDEFQKKWSDDFRLMHKRIFNLILSQDPAIHESIIQFAKSIAFVSVSISPPNNLYLLHLFLSQFTIENKKKLPKCLLKLYQTLGDTQLDESLRSKMIETLINYPQNFSYLQWFIPQLCKLTKTYNVSIESIAKLLQTQIPSIQPFLAHLKDLHWNIPHVICETVYLEDALGIRKIEWCNALFKYNHLIFTKTTLSKVLSMTSDVFENIEPSINQLIKGKILTSKLLSTLLGVKQLEPIKQILKLLDFSNLNINLITETDIFKLCKLTHDQNKNVLLCLEYLGTQLQLSYIISDLPSALRLVYFVNSLSTVIKDKNALIDKAKICMVAELDFRSKIINLLRTLPFFKESYVYDILDIKIAYLLRLHKNLENLASLNLLTEEEFNKLYQEIITKKEHNEKIEVTKVKQIDKKIGPYTQYSNVLKGLNFFVPDYCEQKYEGGTSKILEGFNKLPGDTPQFLVKTIIAGPGNNQTKFARREVDWCTRLKRQSYFFEQDSSMRVILSYFPGQDLIQISDEDLKLLTSREKISMLCEVLNELSQIHAEYSVHGDIKPENTIINLANKTLKIIDFGSTRKLKYKGSGSISWTPEYADKLLRANRNVLADIIDLYSFCDDMYSMGFIVHTFFPLVKINFEAESPFHTIFLNQPLINCSNNATPIHFAMYYLLQSLFNNNRNSRVTAAEALLYCSKIRDSFDNFSFENLNEILTEILLKKTFSAEEIKHDHFESANFLIFHDPISTESDEARNSSEESESFLDAEILKIDKELAELSDSSNGEHSYHSIS